MVSNFGTLFFLFSFPDHTLQPFCLLLFLVSHLLSSLSPLPLTLFSLPPSPSNTFCLYLVQNTPSNQYILWVHHPKIVGWAFLYFTLPSKDLVWPRHLCQPTDRLPWVGSLGLRMSILSLPSRSYRNRFPRKVSVTFLSLHTGSGM